MLETPSAGASSAFAWARPAPTERARLNDGVEGRFAAKPVPCRQHNGQDKKIRNSEAAARAMRPPAAF